VKSLRVHTAERSIFWAVLLALCAIAIAISIRRLTALSGSPSNRVPELAALDDFFAGKPMLTRAHIAIGLAFALALPVQLSVRVRSKYPSLHRRLGRWLLLLGLLVAISAYGMVAVPVGGLVEMSATVFYATAFVAALSLAWWHIKHHEVARHREWMLRAIAILLGIATTRPVMALFFATRKLTHLTPSQFFGVAFWIGFTSTLMAAEWYIRATRSKWSS
jgi:predicted membrane protein DUF2306